MIIMAGGVVVGGFWLWPALAGAVEARIVEIAAQKGERRILSWIKAGFAGRSPRWASK